MQLYIFKKSDPYGTRTRVTAVKGRCLPLDQRAMVIMCGAQDLL